MAWFRRGRPEAEEPESTPAVDDDVIRPERRSTGDWMTMAPIAPTFGPMPSTFRVQTLPEIMSSHHNVRLSGSLGHQVSAEAPSGSVSGLAVSTGPVSATAGHGDLPLREPHHDHEDAPAPDTAPDTAAFAREDIAGRELSRESDVGTADPLPVRPLPTVVNTDPLPLARLPEPTVSRVAADPLPLVTPTTSSSASPSAPLPVARVVDTAAPSHSSSPSPSPSPTPTPSADAPLGGDSRVGGFGASLDDADLTNAGDRSELFTAPPDDLAAPILPRVRRGGAQELPTVQPLLSAEPLPTTSTDDQPIASAGEPVRETIGPSVESLPLAPPPDTGPALTPPTPTRAPAVQRQADAAPSPTPPSTPVAHASADVGPLVGHAEPLRPASTEPSPPEDATQQQPTALDQPLVAGPALTASVEPESTDDEHPLLGETPIQREAATPAPPATPGPASPTPTPEPLPLPTLQRRAEGATATPAPPAFARVDSPEREFVQESDGEEGAPASLVGANEVATIAVAATHDDVADEPMAAQTRGAELPLVAPATASTSEAASTGETASTGLTTPSFDDAPAGPPAASRHEPSLHDGFVTESGLVGGLGLGNNPPIAPLVGGPEPGGSPSSAASAVSPTAVHVQRRLEPVGAPSPAARTAATAAATAAANITTPSLELPLAPTSAGSAGAPPAPLSRLGEVHAAAPEPAVSRLADGHAPTRSHSATATMEAPSPSRAAPDMPLHTAAAHVPSAAQIMVSAGLAERGPNGTLLFANPPSAVDDDGEAVQRELVVQRSEDAAAAGESNGGGSQSITVARVLAAEPPASDASGGGGGGGGGGKGGEGTLQDEAQKLADDARRLYPHIRTQLESDIRRQLEARNRAGRYRP